LVYFKDREAWVSECPVPCQQTVYSIKQKHYHRYNRIETNNVTYNEDTVSLRLGYETFIVEVREETLVYDTGSFLAAGEHFNNILHSALLHRRPSLYGAFFCNFTYMRLRNGHFLGTYSQIYGYPWSFYLKIQFIRAYTPAYNKVI